MITLPFLDGVGKIHAYKAGAAQPPSGSSVPTTRRPFSLAEGLSNGAVVGWGSH